MSMSDDLRDEVTSINSIYNDSTLVSLDSNSSSISTSSDTAIYSLTFPSLPSISLRLEFPSDYPDAPPSILGTQSVGAEAAKGDGAALVDLLREVLSEVYIPGSPAIFDLVEETSARLQQLGLGSSGEDSSETPHASAGNNGQAPFSKTISDNNQEPAPSADTSHGIAEQDADPLSDDLGPEPPWVLSDAITEKKSVFLARAAAVSSPTQARSYLAHLLATDKKAARATHNITAWRIRGGSGNVNSDGEVANPGIVYQDCDDDGESAAGGRVLKLLEMMGVWDVMVVVTRWYGGVLLGGDRFRIINAVAREAVVRGGFLDEGEAGKGKASAKAKGKGKK